MSFSSKCLWHPVKATLCLTLLCTVLFMGTGSAFSETTESDVTSELVVVDAPLVKYFQKKSAGGQRFYDRAGIQKFYGEHEYVPVWLKADAFNKKAKQVIGVFGESWKHGLNPENYGYTKFSEASNAGLGDDPLLFEAMMSAAVVRYGRDMTSMRIPPSEIKQQSKFWQKPLESYSILTFVVGDRNTKKAMYALAPQSNIYVRLQKELLGVTKAIENGDETENVLPLSVRGSLRLGDVSAIVEDIRYRLDAPSVKRGEDPTVYDDRLSQSVMAFQTLHGLKADGIIGRKTIDAMNRTLKDKRDQIIVNLERIRWLESDMPSKYLVVNIPAQTLWAIDDDKVEIEMPVIIGRYKRQTNSFVTRVTGV
ncbi:MAG: peptidoglycan-binding protein, partial [Alphaproteobacteria bacterium]|nr:peptidoglycan-binding protein [Alphaproteobacteria bacterium]